MCVTQDKNTNINKLIVIFFTVIFFVTPTLTFAKKNIYKFKIITGFVKYSGGRNITEESSIEKKLTGFFTIEISNGEIRFFNISQNLLPWVAYYKKGDISKYVLSNNCDGSILEGNFDGYKININANFYNRSLCDGANEKYHIIAYRIPN